MTALSPAEARYLLARCEGLPLSREHLAADLVEEGSPVIMDGGDIVYRVRTELAVTP